MKNNIYYKTENKFFNKINQLEERNLLFYCVTGSLGRNDLIEGWSDIDVLMVFKKYNSLLFSHINTALSENKSNIKIGITFYSLKEFNHESLYKDPKTCHAIELIKKNVYTAKIHKAPTVLPDINKQTMTVFDQVDMAKYSHGIRRQLISSQNFDERSVYKQLITIIKILLYKQNILAFGYRDTIDKAKKYLPKSTFVIPLPEDITKHPELKNIRYKIYIKLLKWIEGQNA